MIWALLAILGVPIWLVAGALTGAVVSRRRFKARPGVFRLKVRPDDGENWPRRTAYGRVVHDVLILNSGLALVRTDVRGIRSVVDRPGSQEVPGFAEPETFELAFDDGSIALVAVDRSAASSIRAVPTWRGSPRPTP